MTRTAACLLAALIGSGSSSYAQDQRIVTEPSFPKLRCAVLEARLSATEGVLADRDEGISDTARLQTTIDACPAGSAVEFKPSGARNIFLTGPIRLKAGVTLLIDRGTAILGSRNPRDYDLSPGTCGVVNTRGHGCRPLILADHATGAAIMGDGVIDGRGGSLLAGQRVTWWDLAHQAKVADLQQNCPRILTVQQSDGFVLYRITLRNSANFHVSVDRTNGFTAWGVRIETPKTARNTDGIDPSSSTNVTITHSWIATGDDNVAIKAGNAGPSTHMTISHNHFYSGHGMSIGSETNGGVSDIEVDDLSIDGADNGIRIKSDLSRGGMVRDVTYRDICMRDVKNPIVLTPRYTTRGGNQAPVYQALTLANVHALTPGKVTIEGLDAAHRAAALFYNVQIDNLKTSDIRAANAMIMLAGQNNLRPEGPNVIFAVPPTARSYGANGSCEDKFTPFPDESGAPVIAQNIPLEDHTLYVAADGSGDYSSIQRAIDAAPATGAVISLAPGTYREVLTIDKPDLTIRGARDEARLAVIVFDKSAGTSGGTFNSATVNVKADDFRAENITIANDFNPAHPQLPQGSQALALSLTGDRAVFRNVRLLGNQDTLYAGGHGSVRGYFSDCYIEGNVDFIFGDGQLSFENCEIHSTVHSEGFITAQGKNSPDQESLFVFDHCRLTAQPGVRNVWLGRPWRPYAAVIFLDTEMDAHIASAGWREWHPGETTYLNTVYYAEYGSSGPGSDPEKRDPHVHRLTQAEAERFRALTRPDALRAGSAAAGSPVR